jgi:hypothetical protein
MKPGSKLKSEVCDTEVMVIKATASTVVTCGGAPMVGERSGDQRAIDPDFAGGTSMGKRYTDAAGTIELLCIKGGGGTLAADGVPLQLKDAKPLPASD